MSVGRAALASLATAHGFHAVRFAAVGPTPHAEALDRWLAAGRHGEMAWMDQHTRVRADPRHRMPGAATAMVLAVRHHHRRPPDPGGLTGMVARYAWGRDYHNLVGKRLKKLRRALRERGIDSWGGVDTAPILERSWASAAGLGFTGKNCVSILPADTSWLFLAVIFVDVPIPPDPPMTDHCGRCTRCLSACPTDAFVGPRHLDARACIAYWTIEARGLAPRPLRARFGRWLFGCDVCQEVCPHNVAAPDPDEDDLLPRHAWLDLPELLMSADDALDTRFLGTPLRRPRSVGLKRNALVVLGNLGNTRAEPAIRHALTHADPVVRAAAVWALARLDLPLPASDPDTLVQDELRAAREGEVPLAMP